LSPAIEPGFRLLVDGLALVVDQSRADQLRCAGNGVVATQAATAFVVLARRLGIANAVTQATTQPSQREGEKQE
jgi:DNA (cytosine-5)-methyltransferase 1